MERFLRVAITLVALLLASCASQHANETSYNLGVQAYKTKNYTEAVTQWSRAVENGDVTAMNNLGYLVFNGLGIKKDEQQAISLWHTAATKGQSESQWHLGAVYEAGTGVPQNLVEAYAWYRCAAENASNHAAQGDSTEQQIANDARESLVKLTDILVPAQLDEARTLAQRYILQYAGVSGREHR
jgi:TPR repeat protein